MNKKFSLKTLPDQFSTQLKRLSIKENNQSQSGTIQDQYEKTASFNDPLNQMTEEPQNQFQAKSFIIKDGLIQWIFPYAYKLRIPQLRNIIHQQIIKRLNNVQFYALWNQVGTLDVTISIYFQLGRKQNFKLNDLLLQFVEPKINEGQLTEDELKRLGLTNDNSEIYGSLKKNISKNNNLKSFQLMLENPIKYLTQNTNLTPKEIHKVLSIVQLVKQHDLKQQVSDIKIIQGSIISDEN